MDAKKNTWSTALSLTDSTIRTYEKGAVSRGSETAPSIIYLQSTF